MRYIGKDVCVCEGSYYVSEVGQVSTLSFPHIKREKKNTFSFLVYFYHDGVVVAPHVVDGEEDALAVLLLVGLLQVALKKRKNGIYNLTIHGSPTLPGTD